LALYHFEETEEKREKLVPELRAELQKLALPVDLSDEFMLKYLRAGKMDVEAALKVIKAMVDYRKKVEIRHLIMIIIGLPQ